MRRFKPKKPTSKSLVYGGLEFRSQLEIKMYQQILKLKRKTKVEYEAEKLRYTVPIRPRYYLPDFRIRRVDGSVFYIEIKGYLRSTDRTKTLRVREAHPGIDIRFVFSKDNTLNKNSKTKYSDWCKANGFEYAIGNVPKHWFTETTKRLRRVSVPSDVSEGVGEHDQLNSSSKRTPFFSRTDALNDHSTKET